MINSNVTLSTSSDDPTSPSAPPLENPPPYYPVSYHQGISHPCIDITVVDDSTVAVVAPPAYSSLFPDSTDNYVSPNSAVVRSSPSQTGPLEPSVTLITSNNRRTSIPIITQEDKHDSRRCCGGNKNKCREASFLALLFFFNLPLFFVYVILLGKLSLLLFLASHNTVMSSNILLILNSTHDCHS